MSATVWLQYQDAEGRQLYPQLAGQLKLPELADSAAPPPEGTHLLLVSASGLALQALGPQAPGATRVDFDSPAMLHRLKTTGKHSPLGKALGLARHPGPRVLDATAGLGRDAWLMAHLGCQVQMLERSPLVHALLADGLARALASADAHSRELAERLQLAQAEAREWLAACPAEELPEVIYLDPMFPPRSKSASVKKDIALLQQLLGSEDDFASLLALARQRALKRVVVKRPAGKAGDEAGQADFEVGGKTARYQVYLSSSRSMMP